MLKKNGYKLIGSFEILIIFVSIFSFVFIVSEAGFVRAEGPPTSTNPSSEPGYRSFSGEISKHKIEITDEKFLENFGVSEGGKAYLVENYLKGELSYSTIKENMNGKILDSQKFSNPKDAIVFAQKAGIDISNSFDMAFDDALLSIDGNLENIPLNTRLSNDLGEIIGKVKNADGTYTLKVQKATGDTVDITGKGSHSVGKAYGLQTDKVTKASFMGLTGGMAHLAMGLSYAVAVAGAIQLIGNLAGLDQKTTNTASIAASLGIMTWQGLSSLGPTGFDTLSKSNFPTK